MNVQALSRTPSISSFLFSLYVHMLLRAFLNKVFSLELNTSKHSEHTSLSAYHLNSDTSYSQWPCLFKKIGNYQKTYFM